MTAASAAAAASSPAAFNVASYGETLAAQLRDIRERLEALAAQPKDYSSVHAVVDQNASEIAQLRQIHTRCLKTLTESPENIPTPTLALQIGDLFCRYARSIWGPQMNVEELRQMFLLALSHHLFGICAVDQAIDINRYDTLKDVRTVCCAGQPFHNVLSTILSFDHDALIEMGFAAELPVEQWVSLAATIRYLSASCRNLGESIPQGEFLINLHIKMMAQVLSRTGDPRVKEEIYQLRYNDLPNLYLAKAEQARKSGRDQEAAKWLEEYARNWEEAIRVSQDNPQKLATIFNKRSLIVEDLDKRLALLEQSIEWDSKISKQDREPVTHLSRHFGYGKTLYAIGLREGNDEMKTRAKAFLDYAYNGAKLYQEHEKDVTKHENYRAIIQAYERLNLQ